MQLAYLKRLPKLIGSITWNRKPTSPAAKYPTLKWNYSRNLSFGFSGCGWLLTYHLGVGRSIQKNLPKSVVRETKFAGASAGSLIAVAMASEADLNRTRDIIHALRNDIGDRLLGPLGKCTKVVSSGITSLLPPKSLDLVNGRLYISISETNPSFKVLKNRLRHRFDSEEDLKNCLLASSYIPVYYETPVFVNKKLCLDGGITNNIPKIDDHTITVAPYFTRNAHIKPPITAKKYNAWTAFIRIPTIDQMNRLEDQGFQDGEHFFNRHSDEILQLVREVANHHVTKHSTVVK